MSNSWVSIKVQNVVIEVKKGDITRQMDSEAIVNAANAQLRSGGGVAGAIHRAAGTILEQETRPLAPIAPGEAIITGGHNLPNRYIIHCLGPVYGQDKPEEELLAKCYQNALNLAEENRIHSITFPAISTGAFGYPMEEAAEVAFDTIKNEIPGLKSVRLIRFVLWDENAYNIHKQALQRLFSKSM